jgi:hypothetical protein
MQAKIRHLIKLLYYILLLCAACLAIPAIATSNTQDEAQPSNSAQVVPLNPVGYV